MTTVHGHRRAGASGYRELAIALLITISVMVIELIVGLISGSLALLADAGHMLTDALALGLALFAAWVASKPATTQNTYGYYRTEILAALTNGVILLLLVCWITVHAVDRLHHPSVIQTGPMLAAAVLGLAANLVSGRILFRAGSQNLNIRGAWLNVVGDALGSVGVIMAGLLVRFKGWRMADPLVSLFIGALIGINAWMLVKRAVNILLESAPAHLSTAQIVQAIRQIDGVEAVHDLHLWTITTGMEAMSGHLVIRELAQGPQILAALNRMLSERFGITHTTFQLEVASHACEAPEVLPRS